MADFSLIELKQNDELTDVVRKSNSNFKNLGYALKKKLQGATDSASAEWKQAVADLTKDMNQKVSDLTTELADTKTELANAEATMAKMVPPVGTTLFMVNNPNTMYPGTTWTKYGQKHPLMWGGTKDRIYYDPVDADGNKMNATSWTESNAQTTGSYACLPAWRRTA